MTSIAGIAVPDSKLAREITELVRDTETPLLFHHSSRVYYFGALAGQHRGLKFDPELLYAGAMFHDMGLMPSHSSTTRALRGGRRKCRARVPAQPQHCAAGHRHRVDGDRAAHHAGHSAAHASGRRAGDRRRGDGRARPHLSRIQRCSSARPSCTRIRAAAAFKEDIIQAFYDGIRHKPETTFGNVKADVLADKDPHSIAAISAP